MAGAAVAEPDYEAMDEEHRKLLAVIRQATAGEAEVRSEPRDVVTVRAQLPTSLDRDTRRGGEEPGSSAPQITIRLFVTYAACPPPRIVPPHAARADKRVCGVQGSGTIEGATLQLDPPFPVRCATTSVALPALRGTGNGTPVTARIPLSPSTKLFGRVFHARPSSVLRCGCGRCQWCCSQTKKRCQAAAPST